jgi:enamine deaminase RidA (YjgF/YER057c/UK114 family)
MRLPILFLAAALASPALAGAREKETVLLSEVPSVRAEQEKWAYADAVTAGDMVYLSGLVVGLRPGETDLAAAYARAFGHAAKVLARAGATMEDVVEITSFHTDIVTHLPIMVAAQKSVMKGPPPAATAVQVARLLPDRGLAEIKLVAFRRNPR